MIEYLFPKEELHTVKPPRMNIGEFISFNGYNPLGKGQQAVHNSGSSMLRDTPTFKIKVLAFINEHFKYASNNDINHKTYVSSQVDSLLKFKSDRKYRNFCLGEIFDDVNTFSFSNNISSDYLYISLVMFFVKEYNYLRSTQAEHSFTKTKALIYFPSETELLNKYTSLLQSLPSIKYLSDICFGRYYFLEVHFQRKQNLRNVPREIVYEFLQTQKKHSEDFDLTEQKEVQGVRTLTEIELDQQSNRKPELVEASGKKIYKKDPRIAKTVLLKAEYKCEIDNVHMTFLTKRGILFSESHHLIPMAFQEKFLPINLDRQENIISLCPVCHRAVHLGSDEEKRKRLEVLYTKKIKKLNNCGITLNFEEFMEFYI